MSYKLEKESILR